MRKRLAVGLLLLLSASVGAFGVRAQTWQKLTSPEGGFSVQVPAAPSKESKTATAPNVGEYTTHLYVSRGAGEIYVVGWVDYPASFRFSVQGELEANRDKFVAATKAKLLTTTKMTFNGHPGIEFTAELPNAAVKSRVWIVGRRPYQLIAVTPAGRDATQNVTRFLTSFTLTPR